MKTVKIRNVEIGAGIPKICVPIVGATRKEILDQAAALRSVPADMAECAAAHGNSAMGRSVPADMVEWRVDWFEDALDFEAVSDVLTDLRGTLGDMPLLMTFRTLREGGEKEIDAKAYAELNIKAAQTGLIDLVDVELFTGGEAEPAERFTGAEIEPADSGSSAKDTVVSRIIREAHASGVYVVASSHDFDKTPEKEELIARLRRMQDLDADILKIAVMPQGKKDVLTLLAATEEMASVHADRPIVTMSMSGIGAVSRLCGEVFGSAITFGTAGMASAPGQIDARDLRTILELIHKSVSDGT